MKFDALRRVCDVSELRSKSQVPHWSIIDEARDGSERAITAHFAARFFADSPICEAAVPMQARHNKALTDHSAEIVRPTRVRFPASPRKVEKWVALRGASGALGFTARFAAPGDHLAGPRAGRCVRAPRLTCDNAWDRDRFVLCTAHHL